MASEPPKRVSDLLDATARELVVELDGAGCAISRAIGDVLVLIAEHTLDEQSLQLGQGYLISDFPATRAVLDDRRAQALSLADPDVDPAEAALLREFGFDALLMLPLELHDEAWGLVEVYRSGRGAFGAADAERAAEIVSRLSARLHGLQ